ncbi:MAG: hypothetical protein IAC77_02925 [Proteobacteria bacterium]|uniref:Uncharacterized protein n=1 Tax=Candidatus Enterousia excrementavium TaxID=2840789 RepID=A0A940DET0_9PROT|nr:hypothetical protein [Candidatus Enterousia excrementavium]
MPNPNGGLTAALILCPGHALSALYNGVCTASGACPYYYAANTVVQVTNASAVIANIGRYSDGCERGDAYVLRPDGPGSTNTGGRCMIVPTCTKCADGYVLTDGDLPLRIFAGMSNEITCNNSGGREYKVCERESEPGPDPDCVSDTTWVAHTVQGYEKRTTRTWNGTRCVESTQYRCAMDWYGNPSTSATGCQHCPADTIWVWNQELGKTEPKIVAGKTFRAGTTQITQCVIDGYTTADNSGVFDYTTSCGWVQ